MEGNAYSGKRLLDLIMAVLLLVLFGPVMIVIAASILLETGQPVFFIQERRGFHGKSFRMIKFRTMRNGSDGRTPVCDRGDKRITRIGRVLRRTRLDELPQLFNVLIGNMSIVGPRPLIEYDVALFLKNDYDLTRRDSVRPGVTSLAHAYLILDGAQYEGDVLRMYRYDIRYVQEASLFLDLRIMLMTIAVMIMARGK